MACCWLGGCTETGPSALLQGKKLIEQGRCAEAVPKLERAVVLLPKNALAWNYLGMAYQTCRQIESAERAYRTALALDHKLSVVRYNLGCLYLEESNITAAIEELRSFTLLQQGAVEGWLKLGGAMLKARRYDEAERSFRTALELSTRHPEAINGLGLIQVQRRRYQEALNHFNAAATQDPPYAPAVLNSAVMLQQFSNNRPMALQRYRLYLSLQPRPVDHESVDAAARQLAREINPAPAHLASLSPAQSPPQSLSRAANAAGGAATVARPGVSSPPAARTNQPTPQVVAKVPATPSSSATAPSGNVPRPAPETARAPGLRASPAKVTEAPPARPQEIAVTQLPSELVVKPAQELSRPAPAPAAAQIPADPAAASLRPATNSSKRSLLSRLIPFGGKGKAGQGTGVPEGSDRSSAPAVEAPGVGLPEVPAVAVPRYSYLSPAAPTRGDHAEAEKQFKRGLKAQKVGDRSQAITEYQLAVKTDPAYYDAYYNLGLAALDTGDLRLSIWAYEIALSLKPEAEDARYNFALALKAGGFWQDAADQLLRLLNQNASDPRTHLSLANLYAQQLRQPRLARDHYLQVLELSPRHPEAARIRFWLAANP